jgi:hypothetical protein
MCSPLPNLDDALAWITKLAILYETQSIEDQKELLRLVIEQIVVDCDGNILDLKLRPPFAYIQKLLKQFGQVNKTKQTNSKVSLLDLRSSVDLSLCDPNGTRTRVFALKGRRPRPLDDGASLFKQHSARIPSPPAECQG